MSDFFSNNNISFPVFLAPLAGTTDLPFRNLVNSFGAGLVVSEIVASKELLTGGSCAMKRSTIGNYVDNTSVQISGSDYNMMADCAKLCEDNGARIIVEPTKGFEGRLIAFVLLNLKNTNCRLIELCTKN